MCRYASQATQKCKTSLGRSDTGSNGPGRIDPENRREARSREDEKLARNYYLEERPLPHVNSLYEYVITVLPVVVESQNMGLHKT